LENSKFFRTILAAVKVTADNQLFESGDTPGAVQNYREALKLDANTAHAYYNLALALENAIRVSPNDTGALTALGIVETKLGRVPEAIDDFRKVLALTPKVSEAYLNLGASPSSSAKDRSGTTVLRFLSRAVGP
jgi:Flp pilus assembly protein TadD